MSDLWQVDPEKTHESWLELRDPEGWFRASVRFDGCIDFDNYANIPATVDPERKDEAAAADCYIHICDLDAHIARLQALKAEALKHFGDGWPR